jgi:hypothetical protein
VIANTVVRRRAHYRENQTHECVRENNMFALEIVTLNLVAIFFTATQFGWLLETAKVEVRKI